MPGISLVTDTLSWSDAWVEKEYIMLVFQPVNIALLALFFLVLVLGKFLYAMPLYIQMLIAGRKFRKARRNARASTRKVKLDSRSRARGEEGAALVPVGDTKQAGQDSTPRNSGGAAGGAVSSEEVSLTTDAAPSTDAPAPGSVYRENIASGGLKWLDNELVENDNPAVALAFSAFLFSLCIIITGVRTPANPNDPPFDQFAGVVIWVAIGIIMLAIANIICDRVLLYKVLARHSILDSNMATAFVEAGSYVASSIIIRSTLTGDDSDEFVPGLVSAIIYFFLGQILLLVSSAILQCLTKYNDQLEAQRGNVAAGVKFAGNLIALSFIIAQPLLRTDSLLAYFSFFFFGTIVQTIMRIVLDRLILPLTRHIDEEIEFDRNWGIALIEACITIMVAVNLTSFVPDVGCIALTVTGKVVRLQ